MKNNDRESRSLGPKELIEKHNQFVMGRGPVLTAAEKKELGKIFPGLTDDWDLGLVGIGDLKPKEADPKQKEPSTANDQEDLLIAHKALKEADDAIQKAEYMLKSEKAKRRPKYKTPLE